MASAFPNLPGDIGGTLGRAGSASVAGNTVIVKDLFETLRKFQKASPEFNKEMRKVAYTIARDIEAKVRIEAGSISRASQAIQVAKGLRASNDRIPTIKLDHKRGFVSASRPNRKRKTKVTMGDVFFGAEFGGRRRPTTLQFLRHRGRQGYFFWQAVRDSNSYIAKEYSEAIDRVLKELAAGAT